MIDPAERRTAGVVAAAATATVDDTVPCLPPDSISPDIADKPARGEYQPGDTIPMIVGDGKTISVPYGAVVNCC